MIISIILSVLFSGIVFAYFTLQTNKLKQELEDIRRENSEFSESLLKNMTYEYNTLNAETKEKFETQKQEVIDTMKSIKDEKQKLSVEEAIVLLQKQDNGWFDKYFDSNKPVSDKIENVFLNLFDENEEKYEDFINEIRNEGVE